MVDDILIRKAKLDDFENIHKIFLQVQELHLNSRKDIFKDNTDPMNYNDFKDGLLNTEKYYILMIFVQIKNLEIKAQVKKCMRKFFKRPKN